VFTTRPDTLYGATYMVLAPEHPLVDRITRPSAASRSRRTARWSPARASAIVSPTPGTKTGVFTGGYAINPVNDEKIPIYIADYVLMATGTGADHAVPAHDERDYPVCEEFSFADPPVVKPVEWHRATRPCLLTEEHGQVAHGTDRAFTGDGIANQFPAHRTGCRPKRPRPRSTKCSRAKAMRTNRSITSCATGSFSRQRYWASRSPIPCWTKWRRQHSMKANCRWCCPSSTTSSPPARPNRHCRRRTDC